MSATKRSSRAPALSGAGRAVGGANVVDLAEGRARAIVVALTLLAAALRLARLDLSPPGLNQDEALSAWTAWCLLKTGRDLVGQAWPIFYSHGIGDNPSMLFFYTLLPFQWVFGLSVWTTRLPGALAGIACIPLVFYVGARLFGRWTGVVAAAILATNPWHLFVSRFGVGASQCPLYALAPLALLLAARLPLDDGAARPPRALPALAAGLVAGLSCYGFHPMRLYFPGFFVALVACDPRAWRDTLRDRRGLWAILLLALGFAVTFGPLAWMHVVDPAIAQRWQMTRLWDPGDPLPRIVGLVAGRWFEHFLPDFLFVTGDRFDIVKPIGQGEWGWHLLPCMLAGLGFAFARVRRSRAARVLLALLVVYPLGDVVSRYISVHALRSAPGLPTLALLAAFGAVALVQALARRGRPPALGAAGLLVLGALFFETRFLVRYFGEYNRRPEIYSEYHVDLMEACRRLRPRLDRLDAVFVTTRELNEPFAVTLVALDWDPRRWFREPRDIRSAGEWDVGVQYGKMHFLYADWAKPAVEALEANGRDDHVWFIVRPHELGLDHPDQVIRAPDGHESLWICERVL
ncbi:MAG TPA: glycosyltransferase family 39 protein [Candidatus Saccharimonadaceae bacterium]|nr:glycosyltransferase family 39 protein [Candidatus Saccharimonadaceae bacterium]